ncbi:hypothetical protein H5410_012417 [Solanum commersonii]|uniref:Uncharacterized protein n=1 Tax=Solanum commersonii TaxID=4109 RepID=A0A9J6ASS9_SOLCO|nr:hypothetical protein H5410_012417 [Solanum commersonii]
MRAVLEQMLVSHFQFGDPVVDYLFERYAYHLACHLLVQKGLNTLFTVIECHKDCTKIQAFLNDLPGNDFNAIFQIDSIVLSEALRYWNTISCYLVNRILQSS